MTTYYTTKYSLSNGGKITTQGSDVAPTEHGYVRCKCCQPTGLIHGSATVAASL